jgi:FkbM family methyltransferase
MLIPDDMIGVCGSIFEGEYDVEYDPPKPIILDIGANVGGFSRWAKYRWPEAIIHAYEPLPDCLNFLKENTQDLSDVHIYECAVAREPGIRRLYHGTNNRGMSSFDKSQFTRESYVDVGVIAASTLPRANIVKCDTEGAEVEILTNLSHQPEIILVEYHSAEKRDILIDFYRETHTLLNSKFMNKRCGLLKFGLTSMIRNEDE